MPLKPDLLTYNSQAWDQAVESGDRWTLPVSASEIEQARQGQPQLVLTPHQKIPQSWLQPLSGKRVLCLASGGGQQGPLLAAAGAQVLVYDNAAKQLAQDQRLAQEYALDLQTLQGDMRDLSALANQDFDLIVHPVSNCFVDDISSVWQEAYRVLKWGGEILSGFCHPILFSYDPALEQEGILQLKYPLPFSALESLTEAELQAQYLQANQPLQFSHSLTAQIGGQLQAGFVLVGFYEDNWGDQRLHDQFFPHFMATRARKLKLD